MLFTGASRWLALVCLLGLAVGGCGRWPVIIETKADPVGLTLDIRGQYLYIACEGAGKVMAWNLKTSSLESEVQTGPPGSLRLYLDRDNRTLRVLCRTTRQMLVYSAPQLKLEKSFSLPDIPTAWISNPENTCSFFCSQESNLVRPFSGENPLPVIKAGQGPRDMLWQPETDYMWVANYKGDDLAIINQVKGKVIRRIKVRPNPCKLLLSPLEEKLLVLCAGRDVAPLQSIIQLVDLNYQSAGLAWRAGKEARDFILDPRGRNILVLNPEGIRIISLITGETLRIIKTGKDPRALAIAPDGSRVYVSCREDQAVYIHHLDKK
ncbi:hypothetical protein KAR10_02625 [bacterium]|nr:hypothetical protein [bacterium]